MNADTILQLNPSIPLTSVYDNRAWNPSKGGLFVAACSINIAHYGKRTATYASAILWIHLEHFMFLRATPIRVQAITQKATLVLYT